MHGRKLAMPDLIRLEYRNVTMRFAQERGHSLTAVQGVSLAVRDGEVVSLIGPSGCGKSTLLNIGSGLTAPSEGAGLRRRRARRRPERACRLHAAEGPAAAVAHGRRERDVRRRDPGRGAGRAAAARAGAAGEPQARGILRPLSASTVGRHAPARGAGPHARGRPDRAAARRAVLGGRRADPHGAAARTGADAQARRQDRAADHPRSARSGDAVRPRAGDEPAARPHHRRDRDRHSRPRRSARAPQRPEGHRLRAPADGPPRHRPRRRERERRHERCPDVSRMARGTAASLAAAGRVPRRVAMGARAAAHSAVHHPAAVDGGGRSRADVAASAR